MTDVVYCPYSNRDIDKALTTPEHIIPLSLGGLDSFTILVDKEFNSKARHDIDGKIANDPLISIIRARRDARGHSGTPVEARWKKTKDQDGKPVQAVFSKEGFSIFDPRQGRRLTDDESSGRIYSSEFHIDQFVRVPFAAKVALGTGHYLFRDLFRSSARHDDLRALLTPVRSLTEEVLKQNDVRYLDRLNDRNSDTKRSHHRLMETLIAALDCSSVIVQILDKSIAFSIGLLGEWHATICVPANVEAFPDTGDFDHGHVIALKDGHIISASYREFLERFRAHVNESAAGKRTEPPSAV